MKLTWRARTFRELTPHLVQSFASSDDFRFGVKHLYGSQVRILEDFPDQIVSEVTEPPHRFVQTIMLQDGILQADCSCPVAEQILCRHCVAGLLKYYRRSHQIHSSHHTGREDMEERMQEHLGEQTATLSAPDISLRDLTAYISWMQRAVAALDMGHPLPDSPDLRSEETRSWVQAVQRMEEQIRQHAERQTTLATNLHQHETQLDQVMSNVYLNMASLYETLGEFDKAVAVRGRVGVLEPQ